MSIEVIIENKLLSEFSPDHLEVKNESHMHNVAPGSESHFKVTIVTNRFSGQRLISRHREINKLLADELANHIHALALHTYTISEWQDLLGQAPLSPKCMGGSKFDKSAQT